MTGEGLDVLLDVLYYHRLAVSDLRDFACGFSFFLRLKPGIHYAIFALISPRFYSLNKLTLVEESQSQSVDNSWQIPQNSRSVLWSQTQIF